MDNETVLQVLKRMMNVRFITVVEIAPPFENFSRFDYGLRNAIDPQFSWTDYGTYLEQVIDPYTIVFACDVFGLHYAFFRNVDESKTLYVIGPWRQEPRPTYSIEWCQTNLPEGAQVEVERHYFNCSLQEEDALKADIVAILSLIYGHDNFQVIRCKENNPLDFSNAFSGFYRPVSTENISIKELERRYFLCSKVFEAVAQGDTPKAITLHRQCQDMRSPVRIKDVMRDKKNMSIIQNSLLRRELERVNVHPYYCDRISSKYYILIDSMTPDSDFAALEEDMTREYCEYVRLYSLKGYSPMLQKAINHINLNLDSEFLPAEVADACNLTQGYLSNVFKKETGQSLLQFINTTRIQRAAQQLEEGEDAIAMIADSVGITDVNYFARLFKREIGMTPSQYRKRNRQ